MADSQSSRLRNRVAFAASRPRAHKREAGMPDDSDYLRRAAEARAAAYCKEDGEEAALSGDLALAYAALARRRRAAREIDPAAEPVLALNE